MRYLTLAALTCGTIVGLALGASPSQQKAAAPSKSTSPHAKSGLPKTTLPKTNLPKTNLPHTNLPHTNLPGAKPKAAPSKSAPKTSSATTAHSTTTSSRRTTYNSRYASYRRPTRRYPTLQMTPTSDRYREIQDALAAKGYLKSPSSGVWDADSIDAMQRFQKDHNLDPTGKLTARGLTALGLGTKQPDTTASLGATSEIESTPLQ